MVIQLSITAIRLESCVVERELFFNISFKCWYFESVIFYMEILRDILDKKNVEDAYFDLIYKFDETGKSNRYSGIDGLTINDFNITSSDLLKEVREELVSLIPPDSALESIIPKRTGGQRKIYIYSIKDRIKAQAIFRVLEPFFEKIYTPFLFSYRYSYPSYYAAKSVAKRYKKYFGQDIIFCADISDYTENIDKDILKEKLLEIGIPGNVMKLLNLFIDNSVLSDGKIIYPKKGVIQGVPIITFFANIYLNDIDKYIGKKVSLYRRVGDDFILFDKSLKKIQDMRYFTLDETKKLGLIIKGDKTKLIKSSKRFTFLGYDFFDRKIHIHQSSVNKAIISWRKRLKYYPVSTEEKNKRLLKILYEDSDSIHNQFIEFIASYKHADDSKQIKKISEDFFRILTKYFFKQYSHRNQRLAKDLVKQFKIPSLYKYYLDFHNGKKTIAELSLSKKSCYKTGFAASQIRKKPKVLYQ